MEFLPVYCSNKQEEEEGTGEDEELPVHRFTSSKTVTLESGVRIPADPMGRE